jgi:hypothetical protein
LLRRRLGRIVGRFNPDFFSANFVPPGQKAQSRSADYAIKEKLYNHRLAQLNSLCCSLMRKLTSVPSSGATGQAGQAQIIADYF